MVMMEEFRRRKNLKNYWEQMTDIQRKAAVAHRDPKLMPFDHKPGNEKLFPK